MRRRVLLIGLVALLLVAYIVIAPRQLSNELGLRRAWATDLSGPSREATGEPDAGEESEDERAARLVPFRLGNNFGYIDRNTGTVSSRESVLYDVVFNDDGYINFSAVSQTAVVRDRNGGILTGIQAAGYPYMSGGRIFMVHPQGTAISEWSMDGRRLWHRVLPAVVTSIAASESGAVIGLSDGSVHLIAADGSSSDSYIDPTARLPVALGVAASGSGDSLAALSGIDPQRVVLFDSANGQLVPQRHIDLGTDYRRPVYIDYLLSDSVLGVESGGELALFDRASGREYGVPVGGRLSGVAADEAFRLIATLGSSSIGGPAESTAGERGTADASSTSAGADGSTPGQEGAQASRAGGVQLPSGLQQYSLHIQRYPDRRFASFDFVAGAASLFASDGWVLIGRGDTILGVRIEPL